MKTTPFHKKNQYLFINYTAFAINSGKAITKLSG